MPRVITDENGVKWRVSEGHRPRRLRTDALEGEDGLRQRAGADPVERLRDMDRDGIDIEVIFPNKGLAMWATPDPVFAMAQCRVYNDWAHETFGRHRARMAPAAALATGDLEGSIAEVKRVATLGFRLLTLPCKPIWGGHDVEHPNYNLPMFDPLWTAIQDANLPVTFHVSTGRDPRAARGNGGAVINYVSHSLSPTIEPVANLCASGVFERFPRLRVATIEAGIGWVPWFLGAMDEAYQKHHFWVRPEARAAAERVLPRALLGLVPGRSGRSRAGRAHGPGGPFHVGQRLSPSRGHVAAFGRGHRAHDGPPVRARAGQRARPERGALLRLRGAGGPRSREPGNDPRSPTRGEREPTARRAAWWTSWSWWSRRATGSPCAS